MSSTQPMATNGLKTKLILVDGEVMIEGFCENNKGNGKHYQFNLDNIISWYPFYFNYDYHYVGGTREELYLYLDKDAPQALKDKYTKGTTLETQFKLKDLAKITQVDDDKDNPILKANLGCILANSKYGFTNILDKDYTMDDVFHNFEKIKIMSKAIKEDCIAEMTSKHKEAIDKGNLVLPTNMIESEDMDYAIYKYLTDEDAKTLIELGAMFRMTQLMGRILTFKDQIKK